MGFGLRPNELRSKGGCPEIPPELTRSAAKWLRRPKGRLSIGCDGFVLRSNNESTPGD